MRSRVTWKNGPLSMCAENYLDLVHWDGKIHPQWVASFPRLKSWTVGSRESDVSKSVHLSLSSDFRCNVTNCLKILLLCHDWLFPWNISQTPLSFLCQGLWLQQQKKVTKKLWVCLTSPSFSWDWQVIKIPYLEGMEAFSSIPRHLMLSHGASLWCCHVPVLIC